MLSSAQQNLYTPSREFFSAASDPTVPFPRIVWKWHQAMLAEFAGNPDALVEVEVGLLKLKELCSSLTKRSWCEDVIRQPCKSCGKEELPVLKWQRFTDSTRHIRAECRECGSFLKYIHKSESAIAEADRNEAVK
jgi:hypothetical protein